MRHVMFQAALVAAHHNAIMKAFADRLRKAGKQHKVIITAVAGKLVTIANALCKSGQKRTAAAAWTDTVANAAQRDAPGAPKIVCNDHRGLGARSDPPSSNSLRDCRRRTGQKTLVHRGDSRRSSRQTARHLANIGS